jgi:phospholipid/cholesterol/gamma-HCH transport system substrate-binding protein
MESKEVRQDIKLGAFVLVGLLLFIVAVFFIGSENSVFSRTFSVVSIFKNVEGLKEGDNVWLSGVKIGTVKDVRIMSEGRVMVKLSLKERQNEFIAKNATAYIGSDGLVGNKIVVIRPGNSPTHIQDNDTINAASPTDTQELINIAKDVGENTRSLTGDLQAISTKVKNGQGLVGELLNDGAFAQDLRSTVLSLKSTGANMNKATAELNALAYEMKNGDGVVNKLLYDTSLAGTFDEALVNVKQVSANSAKIAADLQQVIAKVNSNENALGLLLADTSFAARMEKTLINAQSASAKLDENMEALQHNIFLRGYFKKKKRKESKQ